MRSQSSCSICRILLGVPSSREVYILGVVFSLMAVCFGGASTIPLAGLPTTHRRRAGSCTAAGLATPSSGSYVVPLLHTAVATYGRYAGRQQVKRCRRSKNGRVAAAEVGSGSRGLLVIISRFRCYGGPYYYIGPNIVSKNGEYIRLCVHRRSYLIWSSP